MTPYQQWQTASRKLTEALDTVDAALQTLSDAFIAEGAAFQQCCEIPKARTA